MPLIKTQGIVLGYRNFSENDKLMTIFTRDYGKMRIIAKGAKRLTSKFGGRMEPLTVLEFSAAKGANLDILSQCQTIETHQSIREDADTMKYAAYFVRIIDAATVDHQKNEKLFKLLYVSLKKLKDGEKVKEVVKYFEVNFLRVEGLMRKKGDPALLISEHLDKDVRPWKI